MGIVATSVADAVADQLRARLLAGDLRGGDELRDTELATQFSVARPTVRAAVQVLVADGLLERVRGHSARVRAFTLDDAVDLYRARRPLELEAVRLLLRHKADLTHVETVLRQFEQLGEPVAWHLVADADIAFHRAVILTAGSPRLLRLFDSLGVELRLLIGQLRPAYQDVKDLFEEHLQLLSALQQGAVRPALKEWTVHLDAGEAFFVKTMKEQAA